MNDRRKTKKQLLEEIERERELSRALQDVSMAMANAHDTDKLVDLIANEAARLVGVTASAIRLREGRAPMASAAKESARTSEDQTTLMGRVTATKLARNR